jgi:hypothetical protein
LTRIWRNWRTALVLVQPDTVVRWHGDWLRCRWTRRTKPRSDGRPPIDQQIRALVREMATANPLWAHRGFMANCAHSVSTSQNARCRVCWDGAHVRRHRRGGRSSRITSRRRVDGFLHRPDAHRPGSCRRGPMSHASPVVSMKLQSPLRFVTRFGDYKSTHRDSRPDAQGASIGDFPSTAGSR